MLIQKKMDNKKLTVNIIIITFMLMGAFYFVYKNFSIYSGRQDSGGMGPASVNFSENEGGAPKIAGGENENAEIIGEKKDFNIGILNDAKYKSLKDNIIKESQNIELGRKDPFEVY